MQPVRTKLAMPKDKCRTPQQKYFISWDLSPSKLQDQLSETMLLSHTEDAGWLLSPAHPSILLCLRPVMAP